MVVLKTATCSRMAATARERRRCESTALSSRNEVILAAVTRRDCKSFVLSVLPFELAHEGHERVDPVLGKRVVDGRAHAANRPVTLEAVEPRRGRFLDERLLEILGRQAEGDVHQRPAVLVSGAAIEAVPIDLGVQL